MTLGLPQDFASHGYKIVRDHRVELDANTRSLNASAKIVNDVADPDRYELAWPGHDVGSVFAPSAGTLRIGTKFAGDVKREVGVWGGGVIPAVETNEGTFPLWGFYQLDGRMEPWVNATRLNVGRLPLEGVQQWRVVDGRAIPRGTPMLMAAGTNEQQQEALGFPVFNMVAQHRGGAKPKYSTPVWEITDDESLDERRVGGLHSTLWVEQLPMTGPLNTSGDYVPALNATKSAGDATGWAAFISLGDVGKPNNPEPTVTTDEHKTVVANGNGNSANKTVVGAGGGPKAATIGAFLSREAFGVIHSGHMADKHRIGLSEENVPWNSGHIWHNAPVYMDQARDAPVEFTREPFRLGGMGPVPQRVIISYDPNSKHDWFDGVRKGLWRPWTAGMTRQPYVETKSVPKTIPDVPTYQLPPPGGGGNPPGRLGGGGGPGGGVVTGGNSTPTDPGYDSGLIDETDRVTIDLFPGVNKIYERIDKIITWKVGEATTLSSASRVDPARTPYEMAMPSLYFTPVRNKTSQAGDGRWGDVADQRNTTGHATTDSPAWVRAPLAAHFQGFGKVDAAGNWQQTVAPGNQYLSGTLDGGAYFASPEIILDGTAPTSISLSTLLIASENQLGTRYADKASRLAFGTEDWTTGTVKDGAYIHAPGASGSVNLEFRFLDAAGAARAGTTSHYGHWSPGTDSTYSQGTAAVRWLTIHADNVGALSAPVDALYTTAATITSLTPTKLFPAKSSPSQITADQNDYALPSATIVRLNTDASRTITGFDATGNSDRLVRLINVGAFNLIIANQNAGSSAANRIITGAGADMTLAPDANCWVWYDSTTARWRVL